MSKPREFWVDPIPETPTLHKSCTSHVAFRVIEKSAADKLVEAITKATIKLTKAHVLFTKYQDSYCAQMIDDAKKELAQALAEYRGDHD